MKFRTGFGLDVHKLEKGREFILGGIKIDHEKGCPAHSDGDVLIHAICDSLLGAANLGDLGVHFPDTSSKYKGIDSKILLQITVDLIKERNFEIGNIDSTIVLQRPKIMEYIPKMKKVLANNMDISIDDISIKATTSENLGFEGREDGISAYATCLIYSKD